MRNSFLSHNSKNGNEITSVCTIFDTLRTCTRPVEGLMDTQQTRPQSISINIFVLSEHMRGAGGGYFLPASLEVFPFSLFSCSCSVDLPSHHSYAGRHGHSHAPLSTSETDRRG